ncbi:MAG: class I SAM-dependent methyltransferase [bacterium]
MTQASAAASRSSVPVVDRAAYLGQQLALWAQSLALTETARRVSRQPPPDIPKHAFRHVNRRFLGLLREDLENVAAGHYPRDLLFQIPVRQYAARLPLILADAPNILKRIRRENYRDLPDDVDLDRYPPYYRRTFHWQTDGYFSRRSAELYDVGVEILFRGTADIMRRQVIPPVTRFLRERGQAAGVTRLLDVACGTGRTLSQLAASHPDLRYFGVDLSPYYVQVARKNLSEVEDVSLLAENAEHLPFVDGYFDIVTSVYLFHELPRNARRNVVREMLRVLEPGGLLVIEDSAQISDSPELAPVLAGFAKEFHEPFYRDYTEDDLAALLAAEGFEVLSSDPKLVAKVVVARKPAAARAPHSSKARPRPDASRKRRARARPVDSV